MQTSGCLLQLDGSVVAMTRCGRFYEPELNVVSMCQQIAGG